MGKIVMGAVLDSFRTFIDLPETLEYLAELVRNMGVSNLSESDLKTAAQNLLKIRETARENAIHGYPPIMAPGDLDEVSLVLLRIENNFFNLPSLQVTITFDEENEVKVEYGVEEIPLFEWSNNNQKNFEVFKSILDGYYLMGLQNNHIQLKGNQFFAEDDSVVSPKNFDFNSTKYFFSPLSKNVIITVNKLTIEGESSHSAT